MEGYRPSVDELVLKPKVARPGVAILVVVQAARVPDYLAYSPVVGLYVTGVVPIAAPESLTVGSGRIADGTWIDAESFEKFRGQRCAWFVWCAVISGVPAMPVDSMERQLNPGVIKLSDISAMYRSAIRLTGRKRHANYD